MTATDLLQQLGLNKYEAEAYYALLAEGPLTGYEVGKRSAVPLSRSYDILERLVQRGLALVQPGDPPRYIATDATQFLAHVQASFAETVAALAAALAVLPRQDVGHEFWVLRGRAPILARMEGMIAAAQRGVMAHLPADADASASVVDAIGRARARGCHISQLAPRTQAALETGTVMLLVDDREALVGSVAPSDRCQAVVTGDRAFVEVVGGYFTRHQAVAAGARASAPASGGAAAERHPGTAWIDWEERKQRRLRQQAADRVA